MPDQLPLHEAHHGLGAVFVEEAGILVPDYYAGPEGEYDAALTGAVVFDRSHHGKVEVTGDDAVKFLHNLCSNDVKGLAPDAGCEALFCTATGKVVAHALIYRSPPKGNRELLALDLAPGTAAKTLKHLDRFIISEDVELADRTPQFVQLHLAGPGAANLLTRLAGADLALAPLQQRTVTIATGPAVVRRHDPLGLPGFDVLCGLEQAEGMWLRLLEMGARPAGRRAYETLRIEAGTPTYGVDLDETTFAPEVGRIPQTISYTKGCYLGQEPIVMARDRGQVNRTLLGLKLPEGLAPTGSLLYRDGKEVGRVTSSVVSPRAGAIALAYVRRGSQAPGTALEVAVGEQRRPAIVTPLPFVA
jgi:folate-binding protein YgfZ